MHLSALAIAFKRFFNFDISLIHSTTMGNVPEIVKFRVLQYDERDSHDSWEDYHDYSVLLWKSKYINLCTPVYIHYVHSW